MIFNLTKIIILLLTLQGFLFATEHYIYRLYGEKLQAVFPSAPTKIDYGYDVKGYFVNDKQNNIAYEVKKLKYGHIFKKDLVRFRKKDLDDMVTNAIKVSNDQNIVSFNSRVDKKTISINMY